MRGKERGKAEQFIRDYFSLLLTIGAGLVLMIVTAWLCHAMVCSTWSYEGLEKEKKKKAASPAQLAAKTSSAEPLAVAEVDNEAISPE